MQNFTNPDRAYEREMVSKVLDLNSFKNKKGTTVPLYKKEEVKYEKK